MPGGVTAAGRRLVSNDTFTDGVGDLPTLDSIETGVRHQPVRAVLYGPHGVGKTTFSIGAPKPILLPTEDGVGLLDVARFPLLRSYTSVLEAARLLLVHDVPYETLVIDTLDALEPLVWERVREQTGKRVEDHGYGKGYILAAEAWKEILDLLDELRGTKGMGVVLIAHSEIRSYQSPEHDAYDRYVMRLQKRARELVSDWADAVLFVNYRVHTIKTESGWTSVTRGIGTGERVLCTTERPAFAAKNRYGLPDELPLDWGAFASAFADRSSQKTD